MGTPESDLAQYLADEYRADMLDAAIESAAEYMLQDRDSVVELIRDYFDDEAEALLADMALQDGYIEWQDKLREWAKKEAERKFKRADG